MSASTAGAGLTTSTPVIDIDIDKKVQPNLIQFPVNTTACVDDQNCISDFHSELSPPNDDIITPIPAKPLDITEAIANFRPTHKEVISGIAPHVFDERRTRSRRRRSLTGHRRERSLTRRPSTSYDFYHPGLAGMHGSAGTPTFGGGGLSRRSPPALGNFAPPRPATSPSYNSMKWGASPLGLSPAITVEDVDKLFDQDQEQELAVKDESHVPEPTSVTLPSLMDYHRPRQKGRASRADKGKPSGKRKITGDNASPTSSDNGNAQQTWTRKSKWSIMRIDIQVLKSIGSKIK
ncbi:hypothetical protein GYMLUDRAFT_70107 [Collybiopsis luxurians FD-317 M1]|nr:hypothetical protein GYMLUDRAFT_70107 [Collybiopsis luxurians FD-317 M1]